MSDDELRRYIVEAAAALGIELVAPGTNDRTNHCRMSAQFAITAFMARPTRRGDGRQD